MVNHSRKADKKSNREYAVDEYVTKAYLESIRRQQENMCCYCGIEMQNVNRMLPDGATVQRLDNTLAHVKTNCVLACHQCNVRRSESR